MPEATKPYAIVAAVDASDMADVVLEHALDEAHRHESAAVHVIGVVPIGSGLLHRSRDHAGEIEALVETLTGRVMEVLSAFDGGRVGVTLHVRAGVPAEEIVEVIEEAQANLAVLGRAGSVFEKVARRAPCSVMLARTPAYDVADRRDSSCEACAQTRRDSMGERWFCEAHRADDSHRRISTLRPLGGAALQPGFGLF